VDRGVIVEKNYPESQDSRGQRRRDERSRSGPLASYACERVEKEIPSAA
jgi:hypothetical protein